MAKSNKKTAFPTAKARPATPKAPEPPAQKSHAFRETVESIVIAFVLAFLFRTFEAEAFVIPTGSMAPTLMGRHKDVDCPKCGYRYQVSASEETPEDPESLPVQCLAGMCPMCHYVMPMVPNAVLPRGVPEQRLEDIKLQPSYNGDRILVNKYTYTINDPERWDVIVFKFPGDAKINYIKRLVGLPGETIRIFQGDLFVGDEKASEQSDFKIAQKPADKILAMRQLVHDTDYDPAELDAAGWPLRWQAATGGANAWKTETSIDGSNVRQTYSVDASGDESWLRYNHFLPHYEIWQTVLDAESAGRKPQLPEATPRLIADANSYNARVIREGPIVGWNGTNLEIDELKQGVHWVGDLMLEADVDVESSSGMLLFDLIEAGKGFRCSINVATGEATLSAPGDAQFSPKAKTPVTSPGKYHVAFANVDDQLLLWIDDELIKFDSSTSYDVAQVFGDRVNIRPQTSPEDPGDLAPARIGARDAKLAVTRLQVWRDIYYIADKAQLGVERFSPLIIDYPSLNLDTVVAMFHDPSLWHNFDKRRYVDFPLSEGQLFVMGDNSSDSSDARVWEGSRGRDGQNRGQYLERRLLIGKALCVYWPHSWNRIPGTPIPFPLFPNFEDMRLVR